MNKLGSLMNYMYLAGHNETNTPLLYDLLVLYFSELFLNLAQLHQIGCFLQIQFEAFDQ